MLSTPRQLRVSVNPKVVNPQTPAEPNIFDFEILLAFWLTTQRDLQAKMGNTVETHRPLAIAISPVRRPHGFAVLPQVGGFSDSHESHARLVDGELSLPLPGFAIGVADLFVWHPTFRGCVLWPIRSNRPLVNSREITKGPAKLIEMPRRTAINC